MYAIIENGGKQYKVAPGDIVKLEVDRRQQGSQIEVAKFYFFLTISDYFAGSKVPPAPRSKHQWSTRARTKKS